jgi:hypothetical protein
LVLRYLLVISLFLASIPAFAQEKQQGRLGSLVRRTIFVDTTRRAPRAGQVVDQEKILRRHNGKTIGSIYFDRNNVFERRRSLFQKAANWSHVVTMEQTIKNDLLFSEGDVFDAAKIVQSNRILQGRHYISQANIYVRVDPDDPSVVHLRVMTLDSWTIGVTGAKYSGSHVMGELFDVNFLGSGTRVGVKTYQNYSPWRTKGVVADLLTPNFLGSFYVAKLHVGRDFDSQRLVVGINKEFILPDDYALGVEYSDIDDRHFEVYAPGAIEGIRVYRRAAEVWGGRSKRLNAHSNAYVTGRFNHESFPVRPPQTSKRVNPLLHNRTDVLVGAGLYNERFYSSTMIYGYGFEEYIATGMRAELTAGVSTQEFGDYYYGGACFTRGGFGPGGYLSGRVSAGSYWDMDDGSRYRSVVDGELFWFSNLWGAGVNKFREFVTLRYTQGWDMGTGVGAVTGFSGSVKPVGFKGYGMGRTRLLLNTETVVFTRHKPFGFRLAVFAFGDAGTIGMSNNPLQNEFFSTFGLGIRFKNERLIFNALQIRLGFAVGRSGFVRSQIVNVTTEQRIGHRRFIPYAPEEVGFE